MGVPSLTPIKMSTKANFPDEKSVYDPSLSCSVVNLLEDKGDSNQIDVFDKVIMSKT